MAGKSGREIIAEKKFTVKSFFLKWEWFLAVILGVVFVICSNLSPLFANVSGLVSSSNTYLYTAFIVLPMCFVLLIGEIDISVAATGALAATMLGVCYDAGMSPLMSVLICLLTGLACGLINGIILVLFPELPPMIVTFGTQTLFRGLSVAIVGTKSVGNGINSDANAQWFRSLYGGKVLGIIPICLIVFAVLAVIFGIVQHKTVYGRHLYAMGKNGMAAKFSGIPVNKIRISVYALAGLFAGVFGVFVTSRLGSINSDVGLGLEMEAIMMCILGGILTDGGRGNFPGVMIAVFTVGLLKYGLSLINMASYYVTVITGIMLIVVVLVAKIDFKAIKSELSKRPPKTSKTA